jgi:hypothetical protein
LKPSTRPTSPKIKLADVGQKRRCQIGTPLRRQIAWRWEEYDVGKKHVPLHHINQSSIDS